MASIVPYVAQKLGLLGLGPARGLPRLKLRDLMVRMGTNYVPAEGVAQRGQVVLFTGCVQDAWSRDVHWATISVLTRAGYTVRIPHGQVCCGALHAHSGRLEAARSLAARNLGPLDRYEGRIVIDAAGCGAKLKEYDELLPDEPVAASIAKRARDVSEVITAADIRAIGARPPADLRRIAVHDPCHLNFVQKVHEQPRELLRASGYEVVDLPDGGRCCGAAGSFAVKHSDWARPLLREKLDACASVGADAVAVANPGCLYWMGSAKDAPKMYHPIQLVAMAIAANSSAGTTPGSG
jgi:glycolate oxidase iron-sulfur subunit